MFILNSFILNSLDSDAQAFLTATGITDSTQTSAINTLVLSLKSNNLWSKIQAFYPFVGGDSTKHSYNLKNPAIYQITWSGSVTHDGNGITGDGSTGYGNTGWSTSNSSGQNSVHMFCYCRTQSPSVVGVMLGSVGTTGSTIRNILKGSGTFQVCDGLNNNISSTITASTSSDFRGSWCVTRTASTTNGLYLRGSANGTDANASSGTSAYPIGILCRRFEGFSPDTFTNANLAAVSLGDGLDATDNSNLNTIVIAFQTALSRNV